MAKAYTAKLIKSEKSDKPHEILVHGPIGKSFWSDEGISGKEFTDALNEIPVGQKVVVGVNSQGGSVGEGLAIYNAIGRRAADITVRIDGYALSIASFFPLAAGKVVSPKSSIWMIHKAWTYAQGNANEMRDAADMLDTHDKVILAAYTKKTGKPETEITKAMADETWLSGEEAIAWKLADEESDNEPDLESMDFSKAANAGFRQVPTAVGPKGIYVNGPLAVAVVAAVKPISAPPQGADQPKDSNNMDRTKVIALLKKKGVNIPDNATDDQLFALLETATQSPPPASNPPGPSAAAGGGQSDATGVIVSIQQELKAMREERDRERKARITSKVDALISNCQVTAGERDKAIARACADETYLDELSARPAIAVGTDPVNAAAVVTGEDPRSIDKAICALWGKGAHEPDAALARGRRRAEIIAANLQRILPVWNTNTISTDLKRTVILQQMIRAFAIRTLPLSSFSMTWNGVRLEGTDKIAVPYFALDTTASTDFNASNGYDTFGNTNADAKTITVDKRKYQGLSWTSSELARQPYLDIVMSASLKAEQLGIDVVQDVLSLVTAATYGAAVHTGLASAFDSDDVIDLKGAADTANWPAAGRALMLNSDYDVNLLKDTAVKSALNWGDSAPIREGRIQRVVGFDYYPDSRIPANSENLQGFISFKSGLLVGFSPIGPTPEVRAQLTRYEVVTHPETGATFEYRLWGDPVKDTSKEIIEANYGRIAGEAAAIKRIVSA